MRAAADAPPPVAPLPSPDGVGSATPSTPGLWYDEFQAASHAASAIAGIHQQTLAAVAIADRITFLLRNRPDGVHPHGDPPGDPPGHPHGGGPQLPPPQQSTAPPAREVIQLDAVQ